MVVWVFNTGIQKIKVIKSCNEWKHFYFKLLKYTVLKLINLRLQLSDLALISAKLLRKNNTKQSGVGLHTHYFWCNIHWNFPMLSGFWRTALNDAENSILISEFQYSKSTDKNMNPHSVACTSVECTAVMST